MRKISPQEQQIIPLKTSEAEENSSEDNYEFEPDEDEILSNLLPKNISTQIFKAMLENSASEQGSRMSAMDNATRNAGEMVDKLTIEYNSCLTTSIILNSKLVNHFTCISGCIIHCTHS